MSKNGIVVFGATAIGDVISALAPGGGVFSKLVETHIQKRRNEARDTLISEICDGYHGAVEVGESELDDMIAIILRVDKAVSSGIAMDNLRLLAQIIAGLKKYKALSFDKFQRWCNIIESMTRDELMIIGFSCIVSADQAKEGQKDGQFDFWDRVQVAMKEATYSEIEISSLAASVSRTGLLVPISAFDGMAYGKSPWLADLEQLIDAKGLSTKHR